VIPLTLSAVSLFILQAMYCITNTSFSSLDTSFLALHLLACFRVLSRQGVVLKINFLLEYLDFLKTFLCHSMSKAFFSHILKFLLPWVVSGWIDPILGKCFSYAMYARFFKNSKLPFLRFAFRIHHFFFSYNLSVAVFIPLWRPTI